MSEPCSAPAALDPNIRSNQVRSTSIRRRVIPTVAAFALALAVTACGAGNESDAGGDSSAGGGSGGDPVTLDGGGSTAQAKAQAAWRAAYQDDSDNTVNYEEVGSGTGRENFNSGAYVFAGSDSYLNDDEGELSAAKERCGGSDPIEVPAYVSPIAVAFNLGEDILSLNLSAETIANIFNGTITKWNDDAIATDNPDVELPDTAISIIPRSDDSGTTKNFTEYLSAASNGAWADDADGLWPEGLPGQGLEGTSGVIGGISDTEGSIGYADESAVGDLGVVSIGVGSAFNPPTAEGAALVVAASPRADGRPDVDMAIDIDRTITDSGAYPLLLTSYLIACQHYDDANEAALVRGFLSYAVSPDGQQAAADQAGSAPLDAGLADEAAGIVDEIAGK
jgi:phosphate transport system substrate-binding protein